MQVALPAIKEALRYTQLNLQGVMNAFFIFFGGLLLFGGKLSDLFVLFLVIHAMKKEPLVPLRIFKTPNLAAGNISLIMLSGVWIPLVYFLSLYLQQVLKFSPFSGGIALLPAPILMALLMIFIAGKLMGKFGLKVTMILGFLALGGSALLLAGNTPVDGNYLENVLPALLLTALGNALAYLPATTAAISGAKPEESGLASGLYNTTYQISSAIALAVMVAFAGAVLAFLFIRSPKQGN